MPFEIKARSVLALARSHAVMLATAESCTGGLIAAALTEIPGSSDSFDRGFVTYSNSAKSQMLGVDLELIREHGAVSEEVARAMAEGALHKALATLSVSVTGVAGPGGTDLKPEGMVCFATAGFEIETISETVQFGAIGRAQVRQATVAHALDLLCARLSGAVVR